MKLEIKNGNECFDVAISGQDIKDELMLNSIRYTVRMLKTLTVVYLTRYTISSNNKITTTTIVIVIIITIIIIHIICK